MSRRKRAERAEAQDVRRSSVRLDADLDLKLHVWARQHRLTRDEAFNQAVAMLTRGMRLPSGGAEPEQTGSAA